MERLAGPGNEAYYFAIYMGIAKHNYCTLPTCLGWAVCTSNVKEMVSHSSKGSLIFHMTASITSIVSILAPSSHQHQPEDDYCLPEEVPRRRDESNTYQDLNLDTHGLHQHV